MFIGGRLADLINGSLVSGSKTHTEQTLYYERETKEDTGNWCLSFTKLIKLYDNFNKKLY